jgi:excinuclease ABC subunit C
VEGADDYAMLQEVLRRRLKRANAVQSALAAPAATSGSAAQSQAESTASPDEGQETQNVQQTSIQEGWSVLPDLLIVDGGKGQLHAALEVMSDLGVRDIPAIGLAKQHEEVFVPGRSDPILLPRDSEGLYLLQRVRDEAHRFAVGYHRQLRDKAGLASVLDDIPGIGPKRRQTLLKRFGSVEGIREASLEELAEVRGMDRELAETLKERL